MAEILLKQALAEQLRCPLESLEEEGFLVISAGLAASPGAPPALEAVEVMKDQGLDLRPHEARPLNEQLVRHADLILTMTDGHRRTIIDHWPDSASRVKLLLPEQTDVADPIGRPVAVYEQCAQQIRRAVEIIAQQLRT